MRKPLGVLMVSLASLSAACSSASVPPGISFGEGGVRTDATSQHHETVDSSFDAGLDAVGVDAPDEGGADSGDDSDTLDAADATDTADATDASDAGVSVITASGSVGDASAPTTGSIALASLAPTLRDGGFDAMVDAATGGSRIVIVFGSNTDFSCSFLADHTANTGIANSQGLGILILTDRASVIGTFTVGTDFVVGTLSSEDSQCNTVRSVSATSGTVTLTEATQSWIAGSYDLTFAGDAAAGTLVGSFSIPICTSSIPETDAAPPCVSP
jgi:hypothetical protein